QQSRKRMQRLGRDVDHASSLGVAPRYLRVLDAQKDEDEERHQDEDRRARTEVPIEDAGHVIDGCADVGEHDRPAQKRTEIAAAELDPPAGSSLALAHVLEATGGDVGSLWGLGANPYGCRMGLLAPSFTLGL